MKSKVMFVRDCLNLCPNILLFFRLTVPQPKEFFKHQPDVPNLLTPANTNSNGCIQAKMAITEEPYVPISLMHHQYSLLLAPQGAEKEKQETFYAARYQRIQQQQRKLSACSQLPICCERYNWNNDNLCSYFYLGCLFSFCFLSASALSAREFQSHT